MRLVAGLLLFFFLIAACFYLPGFLPANFLTGFAQEQLKEAYRELAERQIVLRLNTLPLVDQQPLDRVRHRLSG